jgi:hypothetical protein
MERRETQYCSSAREGLISMPVIPRRPDCVVSAVEAGTENVCDLQCRRV